MGKRKYFATIDAPVSPINATMAGQRKMFFHSPITKIKAVVMAMGTIITNKFVAVCAGISKLVLTVSMVSPLQLGYHSNNTDIMSPMCHEAMKKV
jgi:hypothetical protein